MNRQTPALSGERPSRSGRWAALALLGSVLANGPSVSQARTAGIELGPLVRCETVEAKPACQPVAVYDLDLDEAVTEVRRDITLSGSAAHAPLAITLSGVMSAELWWNGQLIGRNGVVGASASSETPGRFHATVPVPPALQKSGRNVLTVRMSSHHQWLPVRQPVQRIDVIALAEQGNRELLSYLPALLTFGALILAAMCFAVIARVGRHRVQGIMLALAASCAGVQLLFETSRALLDYLYPWHTVRLVAISLLAAATATLLTAYSARRYARGWGPWPAVAVAAFSLLSLLFIPSFDLATWASIFAGAVTSLGCALPARRSRAGAIGAFAAGAFMVGLIWWRADALDGPYYYLVASLLAALVAEQVLQHGPLFASLTKERARNADLATRLGAAEAGGAKGRLSFRDGARIHRFREEEILRIAAADDLCELFVAGGSPILISGTLTALAQSLPPRFLRVHKSHVVNLSLVASVQPRRGGGQQLILKDGSAVPVGRTYRSVVIERLDKHDLSCV